jgi:hypothetical protein
MKKKTKNKIKLQEKFYHNIFPLSIHFMLYCITHISFIFITKLMFSLKMNHTRTWDWKLLFSDIFSFYCHFCRLKIKLNDTNFSLNNLNCSLSYQMQGIDTLKVFSIKVMFKNNEDFHPMLILVHSKYIVWHNQWLLYKGRKKKFNFAAKGDEKKNY